MEITTLLAIISPAAAMVFGVMAMRRGQKSDDSSTGERMGVILTEITTLKTALGDINRKLDRYDERYTRLSERVSSVEQSAKSAHHRLDNLAGGKNENGN